HLEQMILYDVTHGADLFVESTPALNAEILSHRDLHAFNMGTVPERLQHLVGEAEEQHAMNRLFAKVMINSVNGLLVKSLQKNLIEVTGRLQVSAKRLFDNDSRVASAICVRQLLYNGPECRRRYGEIKGRTLR